MQGAARAHDLLPHVFGGQGDLTTPENRPRSFFLRLAFSLHDDEGELACASLLRDDAVQVHAFRLQTRERKRARLIVAHRADVGRAHAQTRQRRHGRRRLPAARARRLQNPAFGIRFRIFAHHAELIRGVQTDSHGVEFFLRHERKFPLQMNSRSRTPSESAASSAAHSSAVGSGVGDTLSKSPNSNPVAARKASGATPW